MKKKLTISLLYAFACASAVIIMFQSQMFEGLELKTVDSRFRIFSSNRRTNNQVVIAVIDETSLLQFKLAKHVWPWPRDFYGKLVEYFHRGGAKIVMFDVLFPDPDLGHLTDSAETDGKFAIAMKEAGNVILSVNLGSGLSLQHADNPLYAQKHFELLPAAAQFNFPLYSDGVLPIKDFQESATALGAANYQDDREDGICRRLVPFYRCQGHIIPQVGLAAYLAGNNIDTIRVLPDESLQLGSCNVPLDSRGSVLLSWYGKGGPNGAFPYYPVVALLKSAIDEDRGLIPQVPSSTFKDKYIIVGSNATGLFDFRATPFTRYEKYPAMELHATLLTNLLQRDFVKRISPEKTDAAVLVFSIIVCVVFSYARKIRYTILSMLVMAIGWYGWSMAAFQMDHQWVDIVAPEVSIGLSFLVAAVVNYQLEGKAKRRLRETFGRYLSPVVITEIIEKNKNVELGGQEIYGTVFFSDIKDFTTISEGLKPTELITYLNEYFSITTEIILRNGALLDKYIGDAIMAIFGAPIQVNDHAHQSCLAALEIQRTLKKLWRTAGSVKPAFITRIGIHSGPMIVGNIGSTQRLDFTAIGDSVNLASRLEGLNKTYGTQIILSETTFREVKDQYGCRELDLVRVKGKNLPVHIYELIDARESLSPEQISTVNRFQEGLNYYRSREFDRASSVFEALSKANHDDMSALLYVKRCQHYAANMPPEDWDGVTIMNTK